MKDNVLLEVNKFDFHYIKSEKNSPKIHLKIIEIIRVEYAVKKNFVGLAKVLDDYYKEIHFNKDTINRYSNTIANIEYIMAYTFLDTRNFNKTNFHLSKMKMLMDSFSIDRSLTRMSHEILEKNSNSKKSRAALTCFSTFFECSQDQP